MRGYYSVFNPRGEKIADCGMERDAVTLMSSRNQRWDGHYFTFNPLPGDIIDVSDHRLNGNDLRAQPRGLPPYTASIAAEIEVDQLPESGSTPIDVK